MLMSAQNGVVNCCVQHFCKWLAGSLIELIAGRGEFCRINMDQLLRVAIALNQATKGK